MAANVLPAGGTFVWNLAGRGSQTITNNGVTWQNATRLTVNGFGGTYTLADAYVAAASGGPSIFTVTTGTFNTANFNMTPGTFTVNTGATATLGTSTITLNSTITGTIVTVSATATLSAASSTFSITANSLSQTFAGGGKTFGNLTVTGTQASQLIITGANTFNTVTSGEGVQLTMPASTTNTLTTLNAVGRNYGYQYLPGLGFNYVSAPDSAPLSITSDLTVDIKVALANWSPATFPGLIGKNGNTTTQASYAFFINSSGNKLFFQSSANGSTIISHTSTVGTGFANNSTNWVRACIKCDNGAAGHDVEFYTSADGSTWAKLGATVTTAGTTSIFDSPAVLEIGSNTNGTANTPVGNFYEARVYNSYLQASNGTPVFDANFATKTVGNNTFTESSANAATVTINGAQAQVGDGRIGINSSIAATSGTISSTNVVAGDYLVVKDSTAAGNTPFYAGSHGILVSNNTNWSATNAPTGTSNLLLIGAG
jgi:hypothetical protein